jgi:hypothetical protein
MRLAAALGVPVHPKDNLRAKEAQVIRYRSLDEIDRLPKDKVNANDGLDCIFSLIKYKASDLTINRQLLAAKYCTKTIETMTIILQLLSLKPKLTVTSHLLIKLFS